VGASECSIKLFRQFAAGLGAVGFSAAAAALFGGERVPGMGVFQISHFLLPSGFLSCVYG
jgi:hypothetical protein